MSDLQPPLLMRNCRRLSRFRNCENVKHVGQHERFYQPGVTDVVFTKPESASRIFRISRGCFSRYRACLPSVSERTTSASRKAPRILLVRGTLRPIALAISPVLMSLPFAKNKTTVKATGLPRRRHSRDCLYLTSSTAAMLITFSQLRKRESMATVSDSTELYKMFANEFRGMEERRSYTTTV